MKNSQEVTNAKNRLIEMLIDRSRIPTPALLMDDQLMEYAKGNQALTFPIEGQPSNIFICWGLNTTGVAAIDQLCDEKVIELEPADFIEVITEQGRFLNIPLAQKVKVYKNEHWYPFLVIRGPHFPANAPS